MASLTTKNSLEYVSEMLPIKIEKLQEHPENIEFRRIMRYINANLYKKSEETTDFMVSNIFRMNDEAIHTEEEN